MMSGLGDWYHRRFGFIFRPYGFGKSFTLDAMELMLASGKLPAGIAWPGYKAVDIDRIFGGLQVHTRYINNDPSLGDLMRVPRFVVRLNLGDVQSGYDLEASILDAIGDVAASSFGEELRADVLQVRVPSSALDRLIRKIKARVHPDIPVAVLVDDYDSALVRDVMKRDWKSAKEGIVSLGAFLVAHKDVTAQMGIERFVVTGTSRFSFMEFGGPSHFHHFTHSPKAGRLFGFTEEEIQSTYPTELVRLANNMSTDEAGALAELRRWYGGYCFDGAKHCFHPGLVVNALETGRIVENSAMTPSIPYFLGLRPATDGTYPGMLLPEEINSNLIVRMPAGPMSRRNPDLANMYEETVNIGPMLLQTGLLTYLPFDNSRDLQPVVSASSCQLPNEYARRAFADILQTARSVRRDTDDEPQ
jgi:hypothetical protein